MYRTTLSARGHVLIPVELRKKLGLKQGTGFRLYEGNGKITLVPELTDPIKQGMGLLNKEIKET
jgi:AbrB family looped-hinge helix DNA binding protein